jgi:uncharacterized protein YPO0396
MAATVFVLTVTSVRQSTLVDAITTLLVPAQRIAHNKAAGADAQWSCLLRSYVLGITTDPAQRRRYAARCQPLAAVILACSNNAGFDQTVTLAQVF